MFGSRARGSHRPTSDVDVAVAFAPTTQPGMRWNSRNS
ncbi:MAG TPA: nucleotidyltransferase domain-containing protein [Candidatus Tectomicrobia bacterium]